MDTNAIGIRIETKMRDLKIGVKEMATHCCCHRDTVQKWKAGKSVPRGDHMMRLVDKLETTAEYLLYGQTSPKLVSSDPAVSGPVQNTLYKAETVLSSQTIYADALMHSINAFYAALATENKLIDLEQRLPIKKPKKT